MLFLIDEAESQRKTYHVIDPSNAKVIAIFKKGQFESDEDDLCRRLIDLGYEPSNIQENKEEVIEAEKPIEKKVTRKTKKK